MTRVIDDLAEIKRLQDQLGSLPALIAPSPADLARTEHYLGEVAYLLDRLHADAVASLEQHDRELALVTLRDAQTDIARAMRSSLIGELMASLAHQVNQPLGAIVNNGNAILRLLDPSFDSETTLKHVEEARAAIVDMVAGASNVSAIISNARSLARRVRSVQVPLRLEDVIADFLLFVRGEVEARRVTVKTEIASDMPTLSGERVQLLHLLLQLALNGCDAMRAVPEERRTLTISAERGLLNERPAALLRVHDAGDGFAPSEAELIFTAFYTTKPQGMGLGLRVGRAIVEAHGGRIWATSEPGRGATFHCLLPAANA